MSKIAILNLTQKKTQKTNVYASHAALMRRRIGVETEAFSKHQLPDAWRRLQRSSLQPQDNPILTRSCACTI
jgi:hypothetical protein